MDFMLGIEVTRRCNFKCSHCYVDAGRPRAREASTAEIEAWLEQAAANGVDSVGWSGGEPLLHRDLERLTAHASGLGMRVGLASNGYLASAERLRALKAAGLRIVQVSLDGPDATRAARYRQGPRAAFARALRAIEESATLGLATYVCTLLAPDTADELEEMLALTAAHGAAGLRYTMWAPVGRAQGQPHDEAAWSSPEVRRFVALAGRHLASRAKPRLLIDCAVGPLPWTRRYVCTAGQRTAYLTADGDLFPCTALLFADYRVGNALEQPLGVLLNQGRMLKPRRELGRAQPAEPCSGCSLLERCRGGCPGRIISVFGRVWQGRRRRAMPVCLHRLHRRGDQAAPGRGDGVDAKRTAPQA